MTRLLRTTASALIIAALIPASAFAQKSGGVLKVHHQDSPASMSIIEEATYSTVVPMMGVFNNLVMYKQDDPVQIGPARLPVIRIALDPDRLVCFAVTCSRLRNQTLRGLMRSFSFALPSSRS
jgi:hypothetical protein